MAGTVLKENLAGRQARRSVVHGGVHAFESAYAPLSRLLEHEHAPAFFTYVLRGEYVEERGRVARVGQRGAIIFHGPNEAHSNTIGWRGTAILNVEISEGTWRDLIVDVVPADDLVGRVLAGDVEWMALAIWREFHHDDAASVLGLDEAVAMLCAALRRSYARCAFEPHQRLDRCAEYLRARETGAPSLAEVARVAGVHPMYLAKLFRKRFGYSMGEYLRRQRIAWACEQLGHGAGTIGSIAVRAGFADHAHFTRTFRRLTGCTPQWYRDRIAVTMNPGF